MDERVATAQLILALEERFLDPGVRRSPGALAQLLADDFIEVGSSGRIYTRKEAIESLQKEELGQWAVSDFKARTLAPGVILTTYGAVMRERDGRESRSVRSSIWKLKDNNWLVVFHQGTPAEG